jgi:hypothetical protein
MIATPTDADAVCADGAVRTVAIPTIIVMMLKK